MLCSTKFKISLSCKGLEIILKSAKKNQKGQFRCITTTILTRTGPQSSKRYRFMRAGNLCISSLTVVIPELTLSCWYQFSYIRL